MRQLILFISKYRNTLLLIVFVLFAFIRHSFKNPVAEHAINSVGFGTIGTIQNTLSGWSYYWDLDEVNAELARENAMLHSGLTSKSGPDFSASGAYDFIPARVIEYSYTKASNYITVDAGKAEGIEKGMGVISSSGWVGTVSDLSTNYAAITPLIHARGTIGARIKDKGLGELRWSGANFRKAQLFDIQREHQPMPGDSVYSYTRASVAPPMFVGTISSSKQNPEDLTWMSEVMLSTDFSNMNWVYVCRFKDAKEINELNNSEDE